MIEILSGILASSGFGVLAGGIFTFLDKREERKTREMSNLHEEKMAKIDADRDAADQAHSLALADKQMDLATVEGQIAADVQQGEIRQATVEAQARPSGHPVIDGILRFVRPLITAYLLVVVTIIGVDLHELTGGLESLPPSDVFDLYTHIVYQVVFLAVTATTWWFGSRPSSPRNVKR